MATAVAVAVAVAIAMAMAMSMAADHLQADRPQESKYTDPNRSVSVREGGWPKIVSSVGRSSLILNTKKAATEGLRMDNGGGATTRGRARRSMRGDLFHPLEAEIAKARCRHFFYAI